MWHDLGVGGLCRKERDKETCDYVVVDVFLGSASVLGEKDGVQ